MSETTREVFAALLEALIESDMALREVREKDDHQYDPADWDHACQADEWWRRFNAAAMTVAERRAKQSERDRELRLAAKDRREGGVIALRNQGVSFSKIAQDYGVTDGRVRQMFGDATRRANRRIRAGSTRELVAAQFGLTLEVIDWALNKGEVAAGVAPGTFK